MIPYCFVVFAIKKPMKRNNGKRGKHRRARSERVVLIDEKKKAENNQIHLLH